MTRQERIVRHTDEALGARREARAYSRKPLSIGGLVELQARIEAGDATFEEQEFAQRSLALYRTRYWQGNLSPRAALRLGLIDAKGNYTGL
jgi:hypothetical protein